MSSTKENTVNTVEFPNGSTVIIDEAQGQLKTSGELTIEVLERANESLKSAVVVPTDLPKPPAPEPTPEQAKPASEQPKPTEYQKRLIAQWYETGHGGPAPFAWDGKATELTWMNRHQRRTLAKINRRK